MKKNRSDRGVLSPVWNKKCFRMMRLTFLFVFTGLMQVSANLYSQSTKLSLAMQNSRLEDILRAIEQQSEYRFAYSAEYIDLNRHMNVDFVSKPITEVLDVLFKGTGVKYNIESRHIMLYVENQMNVQNRMVQQQSISGRVTDSSGTPLPGVTVVVKGTTRGTITDANGNYSLPDISADAVLVFSFVGMRTQEISVVGKTGINLIMQEETVGIEEVIAVGYGTQKKANLTGAVVTVDAEDLVTQSVTSAAQAIQGRAPGVQVIRNSGAPGASATIKMRGIGTFGNASPLVLIDGIEGDINLISPNEIETINILKDASSSAIYGTKAANGVILITTRKGASGKGKIQYNVSYGVNQAMRVPRVLNAKEFATLQNEALINNNLAPYYTNEEIDNMGEGTNWVDEILQTGYRQSHNLMFSGGNEAIRYALNGDFLDEKGIQINTWYKRYNVRLNLDADVNKWLTIGLNSFVSHSKVNLNNNYSEYDLIMYAAQYTPTISPKVGGITGTGGPKHGLPTNAEWRSMDPISYAKYYAQSLTHYPKYNLINSFFAELRITNDLSFKTTLGINKYFAKDKVFSPSYQYFDSLGQEGGGSVIAERKPEDRYLRISSNDDYAYTVTNLLTYQKSINDVHSVKVLIGHNDEKYKTNAYTAGVSNLPNNDMPMLSFGTERQVVSETATHWALRSYFGRLNYDFKGKYLAEYSIRYDGSSRFSEKNRWGVFPSASVGWRISDENFMKRYKWMDDMKLRASYGVLGNQEIQGLYESYATMDLTSGYDFNNTNNSGVAGSKYANPNIKWEEAHMLNFGLDMTLFDGSLVFNAEYYNKRTKDLILKVNLPTTAGFYTGNSSTFYDNAGEMKNTGFEYSMHYFGGRKGNFKFDILHTGAFNHNEITKLQDGVESYYVDVQYSNMHKVGESYAALTGYKIIGVYQTQEEIDERLKMITERGAVKPGDYIFEDANGDKVIDTKDIVVLGHSQPAYIMGLTANASYKGFDFNIHLQGDIGQQVIARVYGRFNFSYRYWMNNYDYILERWHGPGTSNTMSRVVAGSTINGTHAVSTSEALQPAGYIKIRNVELGYTIPRKISNIAGIQKFRIYCSVANLANFTKYVGFEVERTNTYQRSDVYPQSRTISFGANIEL